MSRRMSYMEADGGGVLAVLALVFILFMVVGGLVKGCEYRSLSHDVDELLGDKEQFTISLESNYKITLNVYIYSHSARYDDLYTKTSGFGPVLLTMNRDDMRDTLYDIAYRVRNPYSNDNHTNGTYRSLYACIVPQVEEQTGRKMAGGEE